MPNARKRPPLGLELKQGQPTRLVLDATVALSPGDIITHDGHRLRVVGYGGEYRWRSTWLVAPAEVAP